MRAVHSKSNPALLSCEVTPVISKESEEIPKNQSQRQVNLFYLDQKRAILPTGTVLQKQVHSVKPPKVGINSSESHSGEKNPAVCSSNASLN